MRTHSLLYIQTHAGKKSVKSLLDNFKEKSINKFIAFKASFFFFSFPPHLHHPSSFSLLLLLLSFLVIPAAPAAADGGNRIFLLYRKGFISATWRQARGGISSAIQAIEGQPDHVIYYTQAESNAHSKHPRREKPGASPFPDLTCHLSMMTKCSRTRARRCLVGGGPERSSPLERSPSQTNTGLHQGFPQTSTHFSVPAMGFLFFLPQKHINTYTYIRKQWENVNATEYSKKETIFVGFFYHFV